MTNLISRIDFFSPQILIFVVTVLSAFLQAEKCDSEKRKLTRCGGEDQTSFENVDLKLSTKKLNIFLNTSNFKKLRLYSSVFVDKSEMINEYLERGGIVLTITRPTKWGKSINIDMFKTFFEIEVDKMGTPVSDRNRTNRVLFVGGRVKTGGGTSGTTKHLKPLKVSNYTSAMDHQACLSNRGRFDYYWGKLVQESSNLMDEVYLMDDPQEYLQQLLQDKLIIRKAINKPINLESMEETFHRVFLFGGFFNSVPGFCESNCFIHPWNLSIPNLEIRGTLAEGVSKWVANKLNITTEEYQKLMTIFKDFQIENFLKVLQKHLSKAEIPKTPVEQQVFHHQLVGGLISSLANNYKIESCRKAGQKHREYMLTSLTDKGRDVIIVEYEVGKAPKKMASAVEIGIKKLIEKGYSCKTKINHHYSKLIKIYMVLCKRKVVLKYKVSEVG